MAITRNTTSSLNTYQKYNSLRVGVTTPAGPNTFLAVSSGTTAYTSPDGFTWTTRTKPTAVGYRHLEFWRGRFIGFALATSLDGITWNQPGLTSYALTLNNSGSVIINDKIYFAGMTQNNTPVAEVFGDFGIFRVQPFGGTNMANAVRVGQLGNNLCFVSQTASQTRHVYFNLETLTLSNLLVTHTNSMGSEVETIDYDGSAMIVASVNGGLYRYTNTTDVGTLVRSGQGWGVWYKNGLWFTATSTSGGLATSPDGITWTNRTSGVSGQILSVTFGNGQWVLITGSQIASSANGTSWTLRASGLSLSSGSVSFG